MQFAVAIVAVALYAINERFGDILPPVSTTGSSQSSSSTQQDSDTLLRAIENQRSDVQVIASGRVIKLLPDDNHGSRHQRFLVKVSEEDVILIAHNIDLAPRVNALEKGDTIRFNGEYEWNDKGGVVHWTHKDPRGRHVHGWLEHEGKKYW